MQGRKSDSKKRNLPETPLLSGIGKKPNYAVLPMGGHAVSPHPQINAVANSSSGDQEPAGVVGIGGAAETPL